jgi:hypothetical protein
MMLRPALPCVLLASSLLAGCFGKLGLAGTAGCDDSSRYANSESVAPLRVPDDLSLPDESDSLSIPPAPRAVSTSAASTSAAGNEGHCLALPPDFSGEKAASEDSASQPGAKAATVSKLSGPAVVAKTAATKGPGAD